MADIISIVVPCYNEEAALPLFYDAITAVATDMPKQQFEFLFVNDGSSDGTLDALKKLAAQDSRVAYISLSRNFGKEGAMYAGLCAAQGEYIAIMDADLQDPPALLPQMYNDIKNGSYDCVATRRVTRKGEPAIRSFFARMFYRLINRISKTELVDGARDFRLMSRQMLDAILSMPEYNRFSKGVFAWVGFNTKWIEYENIKRVAGETKWSFWKLFAYSIDGIVAFSTAPLAISSFFGFTFCIAAFVMLIFVVVRALLFGDPVAGWPSMICVILLAAGAQLFSAGVLGQYLSKTYLETKRRPLYIVKESNISQNSTREETHDKT